MLLCNLNELYMLPSNNNYLIQKLDSLSFVGFHLSGVLLSISALWNLMNINLEDDNNVQMLQNIDIDYKKVMQSIVCDTDNMECVVHCCEKCPGFNNLQTYLEGKFSAFEFDDEITYSQWDSTNRTKLRMY